MATLAGPGNKTLKEGRTVGKASKASLQRLQDNPNAGAEARNWPGDKDQQDDPNQRKAKALNSAHGACC